MTSDFVEVLFRWQNERDALSNSASCEDPTATCSYCAKPRRRVSIVCRQEGSKHWWYSISTRCSGHYISNLCNSHWSRIWINSDWNMGRICCKSHLDHTRWCVPISLRRHPIFCQIFLETAANKKKKSTKAHINFFQFLVAGCIGLTVGSRKSCCKVKPLPIKLALNYLFLLTVDTDTFHVFLAPSDNNSTQQRAFIWWHICQPVKLLIFSSTLHCLSR